MRIARAPRIDSTSTALCSLTQIGRHRPFSRAPAPPTLIAAANSSSTSNTSTSTSVSGPPDSPAATEAARATAFRHDPACEVLTPTPLEIKIKSNGEKQFPPWLRGELFRVGPGCFPSPMRHLFDGFAMVAKLSIDGGGGDGGGGNGEGNAAPRITHQQRFLETRAWRAFKERGKPGFSEFGTPTPLPEALVALAKTALGIGQGSWTDNASVTIRQVPSRGEGAKTMLAATESVAGWVLLDGGDLSTLGNAELLSTDGVAGELTTAHAQQQQPCPPRAGRTGSKEDRLINLVAAVGGASVVVSQDPVTLVRSPVALLAPRAGRSGRPPLLLGRPWVHEFPCAGGYAVVPEGSLPMDLVGALTGGAKHFMFSWLPELGTRYHVVELPPPPPPPTSSSSSSSAAAAAAAAKELPVAPYFDHPDPNFYFHVVNAFVDGDERDFVFDVPAYADAAMLDVLSLENLRSNSREVTRSRLTRVRVPLPAPPLPGEESGGSPESGRAVRVERLFRAADLDAREPFFFEFPSPNPRFRGEKSYRFAWGLSAVMPTSAGNALAKVDVSGKEEVRMWHEAGCLPGEPLMIPRRRPGGRDGENLAAEEDDGAVLSLVVGADGRSFLLILDAAMMKEIARAGLGADLPYGFHCCWVDDDEDGES